MMSQKNRLFLESQLRDNLLFILSESYALDPLLRGLEQLYPEQAFLMPASSEALCGMAIGMALSGKSVLLQLHDLTALPELQAHLSSACFGDEFPLKLIIRIAVTPEEDPLARLNQYPKLKTWLTASDSSLELLLNSCSEPTLLLEPMLTSSADEGSLKSINAIHTGEDLSIYTSSLGASSAQAAAAQLQAEGISVELIELSQLNEFSSSDRALLINSCKKTGRPLLVDLPDTIYQMLCRDAFWRLESQPLQIQSEQFVEHSENNSVYLAAKELLL